MFFESTRIQAVREMILATDLVGRKQALDKLLPVQRADFKEILKVMAGLPVIIRLLDPPLHEFLPHKSSDISAIADSLGMSAEEISKRVEVLREFNPMLGHRGCRLGITFPEIYEVQTQAILEATCELMNEGVTVCPKIMIPLVSHCKELNSIRLSVEKTAAKIEARFNVTTLPYEIGTMIELPRACLTAEDLAEYADFFSFGTNDLTQTTFGLSRDDSNRFLPFYVETGLLPDDPFVSLDPGVGMLVEMATKKGRARRENLSVGICGEHGGDPKSIAFCHNIGLDYVSCSPFRVPVARLAAAHAALKDTS
jgi:pyruvate,orthophosphate dikinase